MIVANVRGKPQFVYNYREQLVPTTATVGSCFIIRNNAGGTEGETDTKKALVAGDLDYLRIASFNWISDLLHLIPFGTENVRD